MITRSAPVRAVCFRCQLRLSRQYPPFRSVASDAAATATAPAASPQQHDDQHNDQHNDQYNNQANDRIEREDAVDFVQSAERRRPAGHARRRSGSKGQGRSESGIKRLSLRQQRISGNRVLTEASARLGGNVSVLGKPAYAIVMKDGGQFQRRRTPPDSEDDKSESSIPAANLEALVDRRHDQPTRDEVRANIQSLQPTTDTVLPQKAFKKLTKLLTSGFLSPQLQDYIEYYERTPNSNRVSEWRSAASMNFTHPEYAWVREWTPWVPLKPESESENASSNTSPRSQTQTHLTLQGYVSKATPAKERLAIRVMRQCWGLSIAELETQLGETRIRVADREFTLLMRGSQRFLANLTEMFLENDEQIEVFRKQSILRLITKKHKVEALMKSLNGTLEGVKTRTFPINMVGSEFLSDTILEELGQLTNTTIRHSATLRRLHVSWIEVKSRTKQGLSHLEDMAHIVFRLLFTVSKSHQPSTRTLITTHEPPVKRNHGRLLEDFTVRDKLSWRNRLTQWARYVLPVTPKKEAPRSNLPITRFQLPFEPSERTESLNLNAEFLPDTGFPFHPVKWTDAPQTSTVAHFGHILHPFDPSDSTPPLADLITDREKRVFAAATPHPVYLSELERAGDNLVGPFVDTKSTLLIRFWPSPSTNPITKSKASKQGITTDWMKDLEGQKKPSHAGDAPPAPLLEVRLAISESEVLGVESIRAVRAMQNTDVLLPSALVDVRFTQTQYHTLLAADDATLATWQPMADFLSNARLDFDKGKLEMPPRQRFPIPRRLFTAPPKLKDQNLERVLPVDPENSISVSYEFVGLEVHRAASLVHDGHRMTYTSVEAGQGGGRRAELTLEPLRPYSPVDSAAPAAVDAVDAAITADAADAAIAVDTADADASPSITDADAYADADADATDAATTTDAAPTDTAVTDPTGATDTTTTTTTTTAEAAEGKNSQNSNNELQKDFLACCARLVGNRALWSGN
ncbi:hypothetical protein F4777DRAFT_546696 [Nemania sp. FL0916]|nr:hypothetical protein F4777DRAFT_546696 [Nemania sp. FL0916]